MNPYKQIKLNGQNYFSWSEQIETSLAQKKLRKHIENESFSAWFFKQPITDQQENYNRLKIQIMKQTL